MTNQLQHYRQQLRLTPSALARRAGLTTAAYRRFETGCRTPIKDGDWSLPARHIARVHALEPAELWPDAALIVEAPRLDAADWAHQARWHDRSPTELTHPALLADTIDPLWLAPPLPGDPTNPRALRATMRQVLRTLTRREQRVLNLRFGLTGRALTLAEIGPIIGIDAHEEATRAQVSSERVRGIETKALRKLRHATRRPLLAPFWPAALPPTPPPPPPTLPPATAPPPPAPTPHEPYTAAAGPRTPPAGWHPWDATINGFEAVEYYPFPWHLALVARDVRASWPPWHWFIIGTAADADHPNLAAHGQALSASSARALVMLHAARLYPGKKSSPRP
jgi:Helix-turn-helix domain/Sigma-70, region 4